MLRQLSPLVRAEDAELYKRGSSWHRQESSRTVLLPPLKAFAAWRARLPAAAAVLFAVLLPIVLDRQQDFDRLEEGVLPT